MADDGSPLGRKILLTEEMDVHLVWTTGRMFLFSYAALAAHESDLWLANEKGLAPKEAEWSDWGIFVEQVDHGCDVQEEKIPRHG
ncbi:hypothetical protein ANO14919_106800 [Xylariales sp. No.14919]|nr:hypothetical protein ANO14919_106800 [Xylariales sp. No.14919]